MNECKCKKYVQTRVYWSNRIWAGTSCSVCTGVWRIFDVGTVLSHWTTTRTHSENEGNYWTRHNKITLKFCDFSNQEKWEGLAIAVFEPDSELKQKLH